MPCYGTNIKVAMVASVLFRFSFIQSVADPYNASQQRADGKARAPRKMT